MSFARARTNTPFENEKRQRKEEEKEMEMGSNRAEKFAKLARRITCAQREREKVRGGDKWPDAQGQSVFFLFFFSILRETLAAQKRVPQSLWRAWISENESRVSGLTGLRTSGPQEPGTLVFSRVRLAIDRRYVDLHLMAVYTASIFAHLWTS